MTKGDFLEKLEQALQMQRGAITGDEALNEITAWDSMAALIFMALADQECQVSVSAAQLQGCATIRDLLNLLGDKLSG